MDDQWCRLGRLAAIAGLTHFLLLTAALADTTPRPPDRVTLQSGDVLIGRITDRRADHITLEHPVLGSLDVPTDQLAAIGPAVSEQATPSTAPEAGDPEAAPMSPLDDVPPAPITEVAQTDQPRWKSRLSLGASGWDGENQTASMRAGLQTEKRTDDQRVKADTKYEYADRDGSPTRNRFSGDLLSEWFLVDTPWSVRSRSGYEFDRFKPWEQRVTGDLGLSYELIKVDKLSSTLHGGGGVVREFGSDDAQCRPESVVGLETEWRPVSGQTLTAQTHYYMSLLDHSVYRIVSAASWRLRLDRAADGLSLALGVENEYESSPGVDGSTNDLRYYSSLQFEF